jgi:ATP-dependent protease HslVU (ClpYQ) peptidase subunit
MTCIVAISTGASVVMGADGAYSNGPGTGVCVNGKIVRVTGEVLIGFAGEMGSISAIRRRIDDLPWLRPEVDPGEYVDLSLIPRIEEVLREERRMVNDRGTERAEVEMIVAARGEIFHVSPAFAVIRPDLPYMAIGTGAPYALGVLYGSCSWDDQEARVRRSLEAASRFCPSVRPPYSIMATGREEEGEGEGADQA